MANPEISLAISAGCFGLVSDVAGKVLQVSLSGFPDAETRARLVAIRTGLTLPRDQVDELVAAGQTMIGHDAGTIAAFLGPEPSIEKVAGRR
jgi:hypothetical protein